MVTVTDLPSVPVAPTHGGGAAPHGHQASLKDGLAFVNTLESDRGRVKDHLATLEVALDWLFDHDLLHREAREDLIARAADPVAEERLLRRIVRVRAAIRDLLVANVERRPPAERALAEVNRALRVHYVTYLVPATDGVSFDHRHEGDPIEGALGRLAESVARELTQGRPERLRVCENPECRWIFVDTSHRAAEVVRHANVWQPRQGGSPPAATPRGAPAADGGVRLPLVSEPTPPFQVVIESVEKRAFASAVAWPGWSRSGKDEALAVEQLASYASRYALVVAKAGLAFPERVTSDDLEVVERAEGNASTAFGVPGRVAALDLHRVSSAEARRLTDIVIACWEILDRDRRGGACGAAQGSAWRRS